MKHEPLPGTPVPSARRLKIELVLVAVRRPGGDHHRRGHHRGERHGRGRRPGRSGPGDDGRGADRRGPVRVASPPGRSLWPRPGRRGVRLVLDHPLGVGRRAAVQHRARRRLGGRARPDLADPGVPVRAAEHEGRSPARLLRGGARGGPLPPHRAHRRRLPGAQPVHVMRLGLSPNAFQIGSEPAFLDAAVVPLREAADHPAVPRRHRARGPAHGRRDTSHAPDPASGTRDGGSAAGRLRPGAARAACRSRVARGGRSGLGARARGPGAGRRIPHRPVPAPPLRRRRATAAERELARKLHPGRPPGLRGRRGRRPGAEGRLPRGGPRRRPVDRRGRKARGSAGAGLGPVPHRGSRGPAPGGRHRARRGPARPGGLRAGGGLLRAHLAREPAAGRAGSRPRWSRCAVRGPASWRAATGSGGESNATFTTEPSSGWWPWASSSS